MRNETNNSDTIRKENLLADIPLFNPDNDRLGCKAFAKSLSEAILKITTDECLVFGLYGPWGSGKTTCLNFIEHYLKQEEEPRPIIIKFNPWWFSGHDDLLKQFFREFSVAIGKDKGYKEVVDNIAKLVEIAAMIPEPTGLSNVAGKLASMWTKQSKQGNELWKVRNKIKTGVKNKNRRIIVFIDDIDRLSNEEIRRLFKVIKAIADFPNTSYLLAFDKQVVEGALSDMQHNSGEEYLDKIVQVPFHLPLPNKVTLRKLFTEELDIILQGTRDDMFDNTRWGNVFWDGIEHFLNTMRNVKRLINAIRISYPMVKNEVNAVDFIALKTLEVFSSDLFHIIRSNPEFFIGETID